MNWTTSLKWRAMLVCGTSSSFSPLYLIPKGLINVNNHTWKRNNNIHVQRLQPFVHDSERLIKSMVSSGRNPYKCTTAISANIKNTILLHSTGKSSLVKLFIGVDGSTLLSFSSVEHMGHPHLAQQGHFPDSPHGGHLLQVECVLRCPPGKMILLRSSIDTLLIQSNVPTGCQ